MIVTIQFDAMQLNVLQKMLKSSLAQCPCSEKEELLFTIEECLKEYNAEIMQQV